MYSIKCHDYRYSQRSSQICTALKWQFSIIGHSEIARPWEYWCQSKKRLPLPLNQTQKGKVYPRGCEDMGPNKAQRDYTQVANSQRQMSTDPPSRWISSRSSGNIFPRGSPPPAQLNRGAKGDTATVCRIQNNLTERLAGGTSSTAYQHRTLF